MKLVSYRANGSAGVGVLTDDGVFPTGHDDLLAVIRAGGVVPAPDATPLTDYALLPPHRPGKILCCGVNYRSHLEENPAAVLPTEPFLFTKLTTAVIGPGQPIRMPLPTTLLDYEVELAIVIGKWATRLSPDDAASAIFGYTLCNDVSARDVQFKDSQITQGKGFDTFAPIGPCVVTADELGDPQDLRVWCTVNGELRQDGSTADQLFPATELLAYVTRHITLEPGDVVTTGTPAGVGAFRQPPAYLQPGDTVEIGADRIGVLRNPVEAAWDDSTASARS